MFCLWDSLVPYAWHGELGGRGCILRLEFGVEDAMQMAFSFGDRTELGGENRHNSTEY